MINSSYGLKEQPFLDIIYSTKEKAVFKQIGSRRGVQMKRELGIAEHKDIDDE